jgi:hypothetical protein
MTMFALYADLDSWRTREVMHQGVGPHGLSDCQEREGQRRPGARGYAVAAMEFRGVARHREPQMRLRRPAACRPQWRAMQHTRGRPRRDMPLATERRETVSGARLRGYPAILPDLRMLKTAAVMAYGR